MTSRPAVGRQKEDAEKRTSPQARDTRLFDGPTSKAICACGALLEMDRNMLRTKHALGKLAECRRCRNERIARELDGPEGDDTA
jgi:hypothetical protein